MTGLVTESSGVGPVLLTNELGLAVAEAFKRCNPLAQSIDRGSYVRLLAPAPCRLERAIVEQIIGRPFQLPMDLESIMPAFAGTIRVDSECVVWA